jgi:hypothetical protein
MGRKAFGLRVEAAYHAACLREKGIRVTLTRDSGKHVVEWEEHKEHRAVNWVYIESEKELWTVGHYDPEGKWHPDSDHSVKEEAAQRCHWLNGGDFADQVEHSRAQFPEVGEDEIPF